MRNIAIVYATRGGQTQKIVEHMKAALEKNTCVVETWNVKRVNFELGSQIDGVLIGGPVYAGRFPRSIVRWVKENKAHLVEKRIGFFSISLNAADKRQKARIEDDNLLRVLINKIGLVPDFVASFAGALKYRNYFPLIRWQMRQIASEAGGDTDVSKNFEYTDWTAVEAFCDSFRENARETLFAIERRLKRDINLNQYMREFEQHYSSDILIDAPPSEAYAAFSSVRAEDLKAANLLATIRTLGTASPTNETLARSAESFGVIPLIVEPPSEIVGGLVGKFWHLGFGIQRMQPGEFKDFNQSDFSKVITRLTFNPEGSGKTRLSVVMRVHSTDLGAKRKFRIYWSALSAGIRLYMRSILRGTKRHAEMEHAVDKILQTH